MQAGTFQFEVGDRTITATAGDIVSVPGGTPHAFRNAGDTDARRMVLVLPAMNSASFFSELAGIYGNSWHSADDLQAFARHWGVEFLR